MLVYNGDVDGQVGGMGSGAVSVGGLFKPQAVSVGLNAATNTPYALSLKPSTCGESQARYSLS